MGGFITTCILLLGSVVVAGNAITRLIHPAPIHYDGMIAFAIVGVAVNLIAAFVTREGDSLNQKAVNLHMLEDVLGWAVVLVGAIVMRFTDLSILDPVMSMAIAVFIFINAAKNLKEIGDLFLEKAPVDVQQLKAHLSHIEGVLDVHHIHIRSLDGDKHYATMHIVTDEEPHHIKHAVREELAEHGIVHATLELENSREHCHEKECKVDRCGHSGHHHHHHHH